MPRPRRATIIAPIGDPAQRARWVIAEIARLLAIANVADTSLPLSVLVRSRLQEIHEHGSAPNPIIRGDGRDDPNDLTDRLRTAELNLCELIQCGFHLKLCSCGRWFVSRDRRKVTCSDPACIRAAATKRQARGRAAQRALSKRVPQTVTRKRTPRTR